jgi:hypothetical protein
MEVVEAVQQIMRTAALMQEVVDLEGIKTQQLLEVLEVD